MRLSPLCRAQMVRTIATSARRADASDLSPAERQEYYPKIGGSPLQSACVHLGRHGEGPSTLMMLVGIGELSNLVFGILQLFF